MDGDREIRGVWTRGEDPQELVLSDGSRLALCESERGAAHWRRRDGLYEAEQRVSVAEARRLAGDGFSAYVEVRTRAEAQWLRAVADWCSGEADGLERELSRGPAS